MKVLVTGAAGLVGSQVVRQLLQAGFAVRALCRPGGNVLDPALPGAVETVAVDLRDGNGLCAALAGCTHVIHGAAQVALTNVAAAVFYDVNALGTANVCRAALAAGCQKFVYLSSCETFRPRRPSYRLISEKGPSVLSAMCTPYGRSKFLAERTVREFIARGLPAVICSPTAIVGPGDINLTPPGRLIWQLLQPKQHFLINAGLNFIDCRDVARLIVAALERGQVGENYILAHTNTWLKEILALSSALLSRKIACHFIPPRLAWTVTLGQNLIAKLRRSSSYLPARLVRVSAHPFHFDNSRMLKTLGEPEFGLEDSLRSALIWFQENLGR